MPLLRFSVYMHQYNKKDNRAGVEATFRPVVLRKKTVEFKIGGIIIWQKIGISKFYKWPEFVCTRLTCAVKKFYFFVR